MAVVSDPRLEDTETHQVALPYRAVAGSVSPAGQNIVLLSRSGIHVLDVVSSSSVSGVAESREPGTPTDVQWHPSTQRLASIFSTNGSRILHWDATHLRKAESDYSVLDSHSRTLTCIDASSRQPDLLASSSIDGLVHSWDLRDSRRPVQQFYTDSGSVHKVRLSPIDEHLLASARGNRYEVWDLRSPSKPARSIKAHDGRVRDLQWHPQVQAHLTTCSFDGTIKFWNWSRTNNAGNKAEIYGAVDALDRTLQTNLPIAEAVHIPETQGVATVGDRLSLFDCRIRAISDRKAKVEPIHVWHLSTSQTKVVGLQTSRDTTARLWTLEGGALNGFTLSASLLSRIGGASRSSTTSSISATNREWSLFEQDSDPTTAVSARIHRRQRWIHMDDSMLAMSKDNSVNEMTTGMTKDLVFDRAGYETTSNQSLPSLATITLADALAGADDEDDDLAIISGDLASLDKAKVSSRVAIAPPGRLAGAIFAPNGDLIRMSVSSTVKGSTSASSNTTNFRGVAVLFSNLDGNDDAQTPSELCNFNHIPYQRKERFAHWADSNSNVPGTTACSNIEKGSATVSNDEVEFSSLIKIYHSEESVPISRPLAEECILIGNPYDVCNHNMLVCRKHGLDEHAQAWGLVAAALEPVVPLRRSVDHQSLLAARRNLVEIKRRDGRGNAIGVDYAFDEAVDVISPSSRAPVQWDNHPFGRKLLKKILSAFERKHDVQMLAMLTCVLAKETLKYNNHIYTDQSTSSAVRIKYKNRERFGLSDTPYKQPLTLLDPADAHRHDAWRANYANQLYAWNLPFARLEMLQASASSKNATRSGEDNVTQSEILMRSGGDSIATCTLCWERVLGFSIACPACMHQIHPACLEAWAAAQGEEGVLCAAGCGCTCVQLR